jgi:hypothetical protein
MVPGFLQRLYLVFRGVNQKTSTATKSKRTGLEIQPQCGRQARLFWNNLPRSPSDEFKYSQAPFARSGPIVRMGAPKRLNLGTRLHMEPHISGEGIRSHELVTIVMLCLNGQAWPYQK